MLVKQLHQLLSWEEVRLELAHFEPEVPHVDLAECLQVELVGRARLDFI